VVGTGEGAVIETFTTCRVNVVVWVTGTVAPSVPVTVTVYVPDGVVEEVATVTVELGVPGTLTEVGLNVQVAPVGNPEQARAETVPV
jgi:hypothetical protein